LNVLYTIHFYTANALTGTAWIMLIPSITAAFLLLYLHKYSWDRLAEFKGLHISIQALAVLLFLFIPLVFLTNVNLMMFPEHWAGVKGFLGALLLPNVFPRYFHFLCASLILTSLFAVWYFGRPKFAFAETFSNLTRPQLRREFYTVALAVSLAQFLIGPLVLFTLPSKGMHEVVYLQILAGALMALPAVWMMWKEISRPTNSNRRLAYIAVLLATTVCCMVMGRNTYRVTALTEHRREMASVTQRWVDEASQAAYDAKVGRERKTAGLDEGQVLFQESCSACHGVDKKIVGPALTEIAQIYATQPDGIVTWARAPGKKRPDSPQMPAFGTLGDAKLRLIADYMLKTGSGGAGKTK